MRAAAGFRLDRADLVSLLLAGALVAGVLIAPFAESAGLLPEKTVCLSQRVLGTECAGCGMTRSVIALGHGEIDRALHLNWIAPLMLLIALTHIAARAAKALGLVTTLQAFDLGTIVTIIVILIVRSIQIWS